MLSIGKIILAFGACWLFVWTIIIASGIRRYKKETSDDSDIDTSLSKQELQRMRDQTEGHPDYKTAAKITFEQFASFYAINPDAWVLHEWYVERLPPPEEQIGGDEKSRSFVEQIPTDIVLNYGIEKINEIILSQTRNMSCKRVYFSSDEDTKAYHAFYLEVQKEMKHKAEEEKRQKILQEESRNTADIIKMVVKDIEDVKDMALKQRRDAVDIMSRVANGDTKRQRDEELERTKKQVKEEVERMDEHIREMATPRQNAWTRVADKNCIPYNPFYGKAQLMYHGRPVTAVKDMSGEIYVRTEDGNSPKEVKTIRTSY